MADGERQLSAMYSYVRSRQLEGSYSASAPWLGQGGRDASPTRQDFLEHSGACTLDNSPGHLARLLQFATGERRGQEWPP